MEVSELNGLAAWFESEVPAVRDGYASLFGILQHNASQPEKRPLQEGLDSLVHGLEGMSFDTLSLQQIRVLERLDVLHYLGREGIDFLDEAVKTANYDPATAVAKVQDLITKIDKARNDLNAYQRVTQELKTEAEPPDELPDRIIIRVGFENDANIDNVADWRDSGREWYDIIRGVALAAKESPEDTKVVGAATGSIILILAGTVVVTTMLAAISKNITSVAKDILGVGMTIEDLRQKKLLNAKVEAELRNMQVKKRTDAVKAVMAELKKYLPKGAMGDTKVALEASVEKLLMFNEKGGVVDFVAPPEPEPGGDETDVNEVAGLQLLSDARRVIHEYQGERESLRLLTDRSANDNVDDND